MFCARYFSETAQLARAVWFCQLFFLLWSFCTLIILFHVIFSKYVKKNSTFEKKQKLLSKVSVVLCKLPTEIEPSFEVGNRQVH